jgi:UDPglucose 6-dehydrogenase
MQAISIVGTGYVGLSTAVCFASRGYRVIASTHDKEKAETINSKRAPFYEPRLDEMLRESVESKMLRAIDTRDEAVLQTDVTFLTVGTPETADGRIDLRHVVRACEEIGRALKKKNAYHLIIIKSTVVPGTTRDVVKPILERTAELNAGPDFGLCMNPEFLRQGSAIADTLLPDRVVIGEYDERSGKMLEGLFDSFYEHKVRTLRMNLESAEMVKYASNAFLATKISYANEIANICEQVSGVDVSHVMAGVGLDVRINPKFLNAGAGFGGSCLPKDVKAVRAFAASHGYETPLLRAVIAVNDAQALHVAELALAKLGQPKGKKVALLGLAFKSNTDDVREAPSLKIAKALLYAEAHVSAFDPVVKKISLPGFEALECAGSIPACLSGAHCCVIITEWEEFKALTSDDFIEYMAQPVVVDARRIFDPRQFRHMLEFSAVGLGGGEN